MLDLRSWNKTFDHFGQKFTDADLPVELGAAAFAAFDKSRYSAEELDWGVRAWSLRTLDEYRSLAAFADFLNDVLTVGFSFDIVCSTVRIVRDEMRHVELCRRLVVALGGSPVLDGEPEWVVADRALSPKARVLAHIVGSFCIGETMSTAMLVALRDAVTDPLARAVSTTLAADESIHGRFGWTALESLAPTLSDEERMQLINWLPAQLGGIKQIEKLAANDRGKPADSPLNPFGELASEARMKAFHECLEKDILARFDTVGFPARAAWASLDVGADASLCRQ